MSLFKTLFSKDPNNVTAYQSDWTAYFTDLDDTLDSAVVSIVDATGTTIDGASTLSVVAQTQTAAGIVTYWLSGGTAGVDYYVRVVVFGANTTPVQASDSETVLIPCRQL